jgi:hypothetical protein
LYCTLRSTWGIESRLASNTDTRTISVSALACWATRIAFCTDSSTVRASASIACPARVSRT